MNSPELKLLEEGLETLGIPFTKKQLDTFSIYMGVLKKWSRSYNLTALTNERDIVLKHFLDSLIYLKAIPCKAGTLLDAGSGAGFPGLPIKIVSPSIKTVLLEPSRKKAAFLKFLINDLSLRDTVVVSCRIQDYPCSRSDVPSLFDVIVTRALFKTDEFFLHASRLCSEEGVMIVSKGPSYREEMNRIGDYEHRVINADFSKFSLNRFLVVAGKRKSG